MRSAFHLPDLSLRARLLLVLVGLAVVGLAVADFASYRALDNYLYDRVDQQLESAVQPVTNFLARKAGEGEPAEGFGGPGPAEGGALGGPTPGGSHLPNTAYGQLRDANGKVIIHTNSSFFGEEVPTPKVPANLAVATSFETISPVTVGERGGGSEQFRIAAVELEGGVESIIAVPLGDTNATLSHLTIIELVVSGGILVALGLAAWGLIGVGLRPLRRMGEVAGQIAAGDLSRRVEPDNDRTEVGRLGMSLNAMLAQIEAAFAERAAGERRLRRFLADASHELRTPLATIRGYSELYRLGAARDPAEVERAMSRIESESERMGGLVNDLLTLARIDEVREPAREPLDLRELLEDARDDTRAAAPGRKISLTPTGPVAIEADGDAMRRVFANLLRNAVVHTPEGTPIELSLETTEARAIVRIRDHGPGLPPGDPNAVFERFWRDSDSRGRDDGGAGLGLAIVAALVGAHGGTVDASNPSGGGALFTVRLPLH
ncbi:MAG TPA: HAMP domain-containing sensor histidine kinase [Solirubrobacterales bacterium]|jgi:two-component system OmpR family sensor kinase|nr:HAMP domain-containing sensor histidine kinase [Solirubrobacterales bacterium]